MKKIVSLILIIVCMTGLTACKSEDYENAAAEMCSQNYEAAYSAFTALEDYRDSADRANECSQFIIEALEEESRQNIIRALDEKDVQSFISALLSCQTSPHAQDEITGRVYSFASDGITALLKTTEYENFLWFDSLLEEFHKVSDLDQNFVQSMDRLQESTGMARSAAFLNGEWIRTDNSQNYGLKIETIYDKHQLAFILEDLSFHDEDIPKAFFQWTKGMIMMNDIELVTPEAFTLSCLQLYCYYVLEVQHEYYDDGIGRLDIAHNRILTQNTKDKTAQWDPQGNPNIYVRKEHYVPMIPLTKDDFTVIFKEPVKEISEAGKTDLTEWFSNQNKVFYTYELENTAAASRGISVGSSWDDVVKAYGHGKMNFFQGESDPYCKYLKQSHAKAPDGETELSELFSETAQEYMQYELEDLTLRFYFADDKVTWIFWTGKEF